MMRVKGAANVEAFDHKNYESFTIDMKGQGGAAAQAQAAAVQ